MIEEIVFAKFFHDLKQPKESMLSLRLRSQSSPRCADDSDSRNTPPPLFNVGPSSPNTFAGDDDALTGKEQTRFNLIVASSVCRASLKVCF